MNLLGTTLFDTAFPVLAAAESGGPFWGKAAIVSVFALILIWLMVMPARFIGQEKEKPPFWKNARYWAIVVAVCEIFIYIRFG